MHTFRSLVKHSVDITGGQWQLSREKESYFYSEERKYCLTQKLPTNLKYLWALRLRLPKAIWKLGRTQIEKTYCMLTRLKVWGNVLESLTLGWLQNRSCNHQTPSGDPDDNLDGQTNQTTSQHLPPQASPLVGQKHVGETIINQIHRMLSAEWASLVWSISRPFPHAIKQTVFKISHSTYCDGRLSTGCPALCLWLRSIWLCRCAAWWGVWRPT